MMMNASSSTLGEDPYDQQSPVECYKLKLMGLYCLILFACSVFFNSVLLKVFYANRELRTSFNILFIALIALNLAGSLFQLPFVIFSNFNCKWPFSKTGCYTSAFIMFFIGCSSIYLYVAMSFERLYTIYRPVDIKNLKLRPYVLTICVCLFLGFFWAAMPLLGWGYYSLEGALTSCSIEWRSNDSSAYSYKITVLLIVYCVPLGILILTNLKLIVLLAKFPQQYNPSTGYFDNRRTIIEKEHVFITLLTIVGYLFSWSPYAIVSLYTAFVDSDGVTPLQSSLPGLFAKSSLIWPSLLYSLTSRRIRKKCFGVILNSKNSSDNECNQYQVQIRRDIRNQILFKEITV